MAGAYFKVMTNTMIITLVCSFFVTWLLLPVVYFLFSKQKRKKKRKSHEVKKQKWVSFFIRRSYISFIIAVILIAAVVFVFPKLETGFLPEMDEGSIVLDYNSPPGTSLEETDRMLQQVEKIIVNDPDVQAYSRRTGTEMGFFITEPNRGDYLIELKKNRSKSTDEVISDMRQKIESTQPALRIDFGQVIGDMLGDLMTSVQPIEIKILGNDIQTLHQLAKQVAGVTEKVRGAADVFNGITIAGPSINIRPNSINLHVMESRLLICNTNYKLRLKVILWVRVFDPNQMSDIRIVYPGNRKLTVNEIKKLQIFLPTGQLIPISSLADIEITPGATEIDRQDMQSMGVVSARLENRDLGSTVKDIQQQVAAKVNLPHGYTIVYGGDYANQQKSFHELLIILIMATLLVFSVILFLFKDYLIALTILVIAMLGVGGSFLSLYLTGTELNVGSYTGIIMIVGIIGENSIFTCLQFLESFKESRDVDKSVVYAISTRLRPKLMTALGAIIALMPLALGIGTGAQLHQPLAIAVIGGFIIALPLLLIVLPTMLRLISRKRNIHNQEL